MKGLLRTLVSGAQLTEKTFDHISLAQEFLANESDVMIESYSDNNK